MKNFELFTTIVHFDQFHFE